MVGAADEPGYVPQPEVSLLAKPPNLVWPVFVRTTGHSFLFLFSFFSVDESATAANGTGPIWLWITGNTNDLRLMRIIGKKAPKCFITKRSDLWVISEGSRKND